LRCVWLRILGLLIGIWLGRSLRLILWRCVTVLRRPLHVRRRVLAAIRAVCRTRVRLLRAHMRREGQRKDGNRRAGKPMDSVRSWLRRKLVGNRWARRLVLLGEEPR
jgi:hypothetical protein